MARIVLVLLKVEVLDGRLNDSCSQSLGSLLLRFLCFCFILES
jgi:hypothetical protein